MRVFANIVYSVTRAHACQLVEIHACTLTLYHAFACVFTKITFDWVVGNNGLQRYDFEDMGNLLILDQIRSKEPRIINMLNTKLINYLEKNEDIH
jgi:hypothetical protein